MNEDANDIFKSLMAKTNRNLTSECAELRAKLQDAEAYVQALEEVCDSEQLKCAQATVSQQGNADYATAAQRAEARVKELESHLASERITREALIQHGLELETRLRAVIKAGDAMANLAGYVSPPLEWTAARQQGGAK